MGTNNPDPPAMCASGEGTRPLWRAPTVVLALAAVLGGCAISPFGFGGRSEPAPVALSSEPEAPAAATEQAAVEIRPAVMVEETAFAPPENAAAQTSAVPTATASSGPQPLPTQEASSQQPATASAEQPASEPKSRLLSPEEKARVIAELEALARNQQVGDGSATAARDCEDDPDQTLDPQERIDRELATEEC